MAARSATGDLRNNLMKLLREVKQMKLQVEPNIQGLTLGTPSSLLPLLHSSLMHYSLPLAHWLAQHDYDLYSKSDLRFLEGLYKVLRDVFHYRPCLTREQFLSQGFVERKLLLVIDVLRFCQAKHRELVGRKAVRSRRRQPSSSAPRNHKPELQVLTVQETSGISSAWSEPLRADVQSADSTLVDAHAYLPYTPPPSPQHYPPAPALSHLHTSTHASVLTPMADLDVTPNPTPLKPSIGVVRHSSPIRTTGSSRTVAALVQPPADQSTSTRADTSGGFQPEMSVHHPQTQPTDDLEKPRMERLPGPPLPNVLERRISHPPSLRKETAEPSNSREAPERHLSTSIGLTRPQVTTLGGTGSAGSQGRSMSVEAVDATRLRPSKGDDGGSPDSWHSLPLRGEEGGERDHQESGSTQAQPAVLMPPPLSEIGSQVEQLTRLVERMSARFVLLETRLKMAGDQEEAGNRSSVSDHPPLTTSESQFIFPKNPTNSTLSVLSSQKGPEAITMETKSTVLPFRRHISTVTPTPPVTATSELKLTEKSPKKTKTALDQHQLKHPPSPWLPGSNETTPTRLPNGAEPQSQLLQSGSEKWLRRRAPVLSAHGLTFQSPPCTGYTPIAAACTPEDTRHLIEDLRNRAKRTREFLEKANSRDLRTSL